MNDILEKIKYILNGQVHSNREILSHKGKSLVYWLINCVISILFWGKTSFLQGVHLIFFHVHCKYFPVGCLSSMLFICLFFTYFSNFMQVNLYDVLIILYENNNFIPFPKVTKLLISISLSAESRIPRTKVSDYGDYFVIRNMVCEDRSPKFKAQFGVFIVIVW